MYCVGLTGNIASGKSTVINYFKSLGIEVISADLIAKQLTEPNTPTLNKISAYFGATSLKFDGTLDRKTLRSIIFKNPEKRLWLESLLHPLIREEIYLQATTTKSPYCVIEIPLLLDRYDYSYINRVLVVISSIQTQIDRVIERDTCSYTQAQAILAAQPDEIARRQIADDLIINNSTLEALKERVLQLNQNYLKLASEVIG